MPETARGQRPIVLTLRALGLGDLLTAVPALRGIRNAYPDHHHVLAAPRWLAPIVAMTGSVDEHLPAGPLEPLPPAVHGAEVAVNLHGCGPQSHEMLIATGARRLIAYRHPKVRLTAKSRPWRADEHEVLRWCELLAWEGIEADPLDLGIAPPAGHVPDGLNGATIVHPGAQFPSKQWPAERFAAVVRAELEGGRPVAVTGSASEAPLARHIAGLAGLPEQAVLAGATDLAALARIVARGSRVVAGDTGIVHLATAVGTPSVVLFGPVPPARWRALPPTPAQVALWPGPPSDPFASEPSPALLAITVEDVLGALEGLARGEVSGGHQQHAGRAAGELGSAS